MTIVRFGLSPRKASLSRTEMQQHWRTEHARRFAQVPGLVSYVQNHAVLGRQELPLLGDPSFDIFSEVEFPSQVELERAIQGSYFRDVILPDEQCLFDASKRTFLLAKRDAVVGVPKPQAYKLVSFLGKPCGTARHGPSSAQRSPWERGHRSPHCVISYTVASTSGDSLGTVETVLQHYFDSLAKALAYHVSIAEESDDGALLKAVVVHEFEVVPRSLDQVHA